VKQTFDSYIGGAVWGKKLGEFFFSEKELQIVIARIEKRGEKTELWGGKKGHSKPNPWSELGKLRFRVRLPRLGKNETMK